MVIYRTSSYRVSLFKVCLVVWLRFACFCSYWNNFVWFTQPLSQCDVLWSGRKVCSASHRRFSSWNDGPSSHYNDGLRLTVAGAQSQCTLREVCPTEANQTHLRNKPETWAEHRELFFFFFRMSGIGGFGKLKNSRSWPHLQEKWASHHRQQTQGSDEGQDRISLHNLCSYTQGPLTLAGQYCGHAPKGEKKGKFDLKMTGSVSTSVTVFINGLNSYSFSGDILPHV